MLFEPIDKFENNQPSRYYEKIVLETADRIITVGNNLADSFASKAAGINEKIRIIPNGFDEKDFEKIAGKNLENLLKGVRFDDLV